MAKKPGLALGLDLAGDALEGLGSAAGGAMQAAGTVIASTITAAGTALGGALQGAMSPTPVTINNLGVAGGAGRERIQSLPSIPPVTNKPRPSIPANADSNQLLRIAVDYLSSIDNTLKNQLAYDRAVVVAQQQAVREAKIEESGSSVFSRIGDSIGAKVEGIKQAGRNKVKDVASMVGGILKKSLLAGAALGALSLDTSDIAKLGENVREFKDKYGWLIETAGWASLGAGLVGLIKTGAKGGVAGLGVSIVSALLATGAFDSMFNSLGIDPDKQKLAKASGSLVTAGVAYSAFRKLSPRVAERVLELRTRPGAARYAAEIAKSADYVKKFSWFKKLSKPIQRFVLHLIAKVPKKILTRLVTAIATTAAGFATSYTGVGAILAFVSALATVYFIADLVKTIWDLYWDWSDTEEAQEFNRKFAPQAQAATAPSMSGTAPVVNKPSSSGTAESAVRFFMSKGWSNAQAAGIVGNLIAESNLNPNAVGDNGNAYGLAQWNQKVSPDRVAKFKEIIGVDLRNSTFDQQLAFIDWELRNTEKAAGAALAQATSPGEAATIVDKKYERSSGISRGARINSAEAIAGGDYSNISAARARQGAGQESSAGEVAVDRIMQGLQRLRSFTTMDTTAANPSAVYSQDFNVYNKASRISEEQKALEGKMLADKDVTNQKNIQASQQMPASEVLKSINNGIVDALSPNYKVSSDNVLNQYVNYFGLSRAA